MYDGGKIITGIILFLVLFTVPVWYNLASGKADQVPELEIEFSTDSQFLPLSLVNSIFTVGIFPAVVQVILVEAPAARVPPPFGAVTVIFAACV